MHTFVDLTDPLLADLLKRGAVGIIPTDTLYGIVASAHNKQAVERVYRLRKRDPHKACIVLVGARDQIHDTAAWQPIDWHMTKRYWPGPFSIVVPTTAMTPTYLHHGDQSPPYRVPDYPKLRVLLNRVGPLVAPSANLQGQPPATTIEEARGYFGNKVDFYVDSGHLTGEPSTLLSTQGNKIHIIRQGVGILDPTDLS